MSAEPEGAIGGTLIENHVYRAEPWWDRCVTCGLSMAAHVHVAAQTLSAMETELAGLTYRCPYCIDRRIDPCPHGREGAIGLDLKPLGGTHGEPPGRS
jgi:hypothetical protein